MKRCSLPIAAGVSSVSLVAGLLVAGASAQQARTQEAAPAASSAQERASGRPTGFPDLRAGLLATPGCLGVEAARTESGKSVIFAWFESKKACLDWYYSPMHTGAADRFFPGRPEHTPLAHVPDDSGPLMVIASITFAERQHFEGVGLPISQIAIELYAPVPGGLYAGGRFAPDTLEVMGMQSAASDE